MPRLWFGVRLVKALIIFLISTLCFAKPSPIKKGVYEVIKEKSFDQCVEFNNPGACLKNVKTTYKKGDFIFSDKSFFDSKIDASTVGFSLFGQNRAFKQDEVKYSSVASCKSLKKIYKTHLSVLDKSCKVDNDCKLANLRYQNCGGALSFSKSVPKHYIEFVNKKLNELWKFCNYVHPPCAYLNRYPKCVEGTCKAIEGMHPSQRMDFAEPSRNKKQRPIKK